MNKARITKELEDIEKGLSEEAHIVFSIVTEAMMKQIPAGTIAPQDIVDGLEAALKVTRLFPETDIGRGH